MDTIFSAINVNTDTSSDINVRMGTISYAINAKPMNKILSAINVKMDTSF